MRIQFDVGGPVLNLQLNPMIVLICVLIKSQRFRLFTGISCTFSIDIVCGGGVHGDHFQYCLQKWSLSFNIVRIYWFFFKAVVSSFLKPIRLGSVVKFFCVRKMLSNNIICFVLAKGSTFLRLI